MKYRRYFLLASITFLILLSAALFTLISSYTSQEDNSCYRIKADSHIKTAITVGTDTATLLTEPGKSSDTTTIQFSGRASFTPASITLTPFNRSASILATDSHGYQYTLGVNIFTDSNREFISVCVTPSGVA
jgi:hypothetical protein